MQGSCGERQTTFVDEVVFGLHCVQRPGRPQDTIVGRGQRTKPTSTGHPVAKGWRSNETKVVAIAQTIFRYGTDVAKLVVPVES